MTDKIGAGDATDRLATQMMFTGGVVHKLWGLISKTR